MDIAATESHSGVSGAFILLSGSKLAPNLPRQTVSRMRLFTLALRDDSSDPFPEALSPNLPLSVM